MSFLSKLSLKREPLVYLAAAAGAAYVAYEVVVNGQSVQSVVGDNFGELLVGGLLTVLARLSVYRPKTVEEQHYGDEPVVVHTGEGAYH